MANDYLWLTSIVSIVQRPVVDIKNRPRIPIPDEDPYSVAGNGSGGSSGSSGFAHNNAMLANGNGTGNQNNNNNGIGNNNNNNSNGNHNGHLQQQLQHQQQLTGMPMNGSGNGTAIGNGNALHLNNGHNMSPNGVNGGVGGVGGVIGSAMAGHMASKREQLLVQTQQQLVHKRNEKPPKLPPRDNGYAHDIPKVS